MHGMIRLSLLLIIAVVCISQLFKRLTSYKEHRRRQRDVREWRAAMTRQPSAESRHVAPLPCLEDKGHASRPPYQVPDHAIAREENQPASKL